MAGSASSAKAFIKSDQILSWLGSIQTISTCRVVSPNCLIKVSQVTARFTVSWQLYTSAWSSLFGKMSWTLWSWVDHNDSFSCHVCMLMVCIDVMVIMARWSCSARSGCLSVIDASFSSFSYCPSSSPFASHCSLSFLIAATVAVLSLLSINTEVQLANLEFILAYMQDLWVALLWDSLAVMFNQAHQALAKSGVMICTCGCRWFPGVSTSERAEVEFGSYLRAWGTTSPTRFLQAM